MSDEAKKAAARAEMKRLAELGNVDAQRRADKLGIQYDKPSLEVAQASEEASQAATFERRADTGVAAGAMGGAMGGAAIGSGLGPVGTVGGAVLGAGIGAVTARTGADITRNVMAERGLPVPPPRTGMQNVREGLSEMAFEAGAAGAGTVARPIINRTIRPLYDWGKDKAFRAVTGLQRGEADELVQRARNLGVEMDLADIATPTRRKFVTQGLGKFPFAAPGIIEGAKRKITQVGAWTNRTALRWGPVLSDPAIALHMDKIADQRYKAFRNMVTNKYDAAILAARTKGATVDMRRIQAAAEDAFFEIARQDPVKKTGKAMKDFVAVRGKVTDFLSETVDLAGNQTFEQFEGYLKRMDDLMTAAQNEGFDLRILTNIKNVSNDALMRDATDPHVAGLFREARDFFSTVTSTLFETRTANKLNRVERARFRISGITRVGTRHPDETFKIVWKENSPEALSEVRKLMGKPTFNMAVANRIDLAFKAGFNPESLKTGQGQIFNANEYRKALGLTRDTSDKFEATKEMLKGTGVDVDELKTIGDLLERFVLSMPADVAQLVARSAVIGGWKSAMRNVLIPMGGLGAMGGGAAGGIAGAGVGGISLFGAGFAALMLTRGLSRVFGNPKYVELFKTALDDTVAHQQRRIAAFTLMTALDKEETADERVLQMEQGVSAIRGRAATVAP